MSYEQCQRIAAQLKWLSEAPDLIRSNRFPYPARLFNNCNSPPQGGSINARRLGLQFEQIVKLFLSNRPEVSDIKNNIQILVAGKTVGEADLLFRFSEQWWHLELALKFYLRQPGIEGLKGYFGPNRQDRFDLKWQHLTEHQIQILRDPSALAAIGCTPIDNLNTAILMKGWLFQHPDDRRTELPEPINPSHARGWWVHQSELEAWLEKLPRSAAYLIVEKPLWLYPVRYIRHTALSRKQLLARIEKTRFPTQVWVVIGEGYSRQLISRGYVVSDDWEHQP